MKNIVKKWYFWLIIVSAIITVLILPVPIDNYLDLYAPQYRVLKNTSKLFEHNTIMPFCGGISRDFLPSEFKLNTLINYIFTPILGYKIMYLIKAVASVLGLALVGEVCFEKARKYNWIFMLAGYVYGIVNVFPTQELSFAAIPFIAVITYICIKKEKNGYLFWLALVPFCVNLFYIGAAIWIILLAIAIYKLIKSFKRYLPFFIAVITMGLLLVGSEYRFVFSFANSSYARLPKVEVTFDVVPKMSAGKYFSTDFFEGVLEDINYAGQWSMGYGIDNSVLSYNRVHTISNPLSNVDDVLYEDVDEILGEYNPDVIDINLDKFKECDGRLLFSATDIKNADEAGFNLIYQASDADSDYKVYVYETKERFREKEHCNVPYEERDNEEFDIAIANEKEDKLIEYAKAANEYKKNNKRLSNREIIDNLGKEEEIRTLYDELLNDFDKMNTTYTMYDLEYYKDVNDETIIDKKEAYYDKYLDTSDKWFIAMRELSKSPYYDIVCDVLSKEDAKSLKKYEEMTDEDKQIMLRCDELKSDYEQALIAECQVSYNGQDWDFDNVDAGYESGQLTMEDYMKVYGLLLDEKQKAVEDIFLELVELRTKQAKNEDYSNYAKYAYENIYARDYSVSDAKRLFKNLSRNYWIMMFTIPPADESNYTMEPGYLTADGRQTFENILPYMEELEPELGAAMQHLLDNNLFDMDSSDSKTGVGFTTALSSFGDAYILDSPYESYSDVYTFVHEFGHYANIYYSVEPELLSTSNLDVSEIHSQGLELLFMDSFDDIYGDYNGEYLRRNELSRMIDIIPSAAIVSEFEIYVYEHPDKTMEEYNEQYVKIAKKFGYDYTDIPNIWIMTPHIFSSPCYYISYLTSDLSALELYNISQDNKEVAMEKYMMLLSYPSIYPYNTSIEYTYLSNIFKHGNAGRIMKNAYRNLSGQ